MTRRRLAVLALVPALGVIAALFGAVSPALAQGQGAPVDDIPLIWTTNAGQGGFEIYDTGHTNQAEIRTSIQGTAIEAVNPEVISGVTYFQLEDPAGLCMNEGNAPAVKWESCPVDSSNELVTLAGTGGNEIEFKADSEYMTAASQSNDALLSLSATATPSANNTWEYSNPEPAMEVMPVDFSGPTSADWTTIADDKDNPAGSTVGAIFEACDPLGNCGGAATEANPQWQTELSALDSDGVEMLYYLSSVNGTVPLSTMETDISKAESWYGGYESYMGFLIDQVYPTGESTTQCSGAATCQDYYQDLDQYIDGPTADGDLDLNVRVMLNPGTPPDENYFAGDNSGANGTPEIIQMFENDSADVSSFAMPSWAVDIPDHDFAATVEGADATWDSTNQGYLNTLMSDGIGNVYMTNQGSATKGAAYSALPPWYSSLLTGAASEAPGAGYGLLTVP
jgi:hypothetical protein